MKKVGRDGIGSTTATALKRCKDLSDDLPGEPIILWAINNFY